MSSIRSLLTLLATATLLNTALAAPSNCTGSSSDKPYLTYLNATGSVAVQGWNLQTPGNILEGSTWNFTTGVSSLPKSGNQPGYTAQQRFWLATSPQQDLQSPSLGFTGCAFFIQGWNDKLQKDGLHDKGDCSTMFSQNCINQIRIMAEQAAEQTVGPNNLCSAWVSSFSSSVPAACQMAFGKHWPDVYAAPLTYSPSSSACEPSGNGSLNDGYILTLDKQPPPNDQTTTAYQNAVMDVTMIVPVILSNSSKIADARVACVRPSQISSHSQTPVSRGAALGVGIGGLTGLMLGMTAFVMLLL